MNDPDLETVVQEAFERQAVSAPRPSAALLETVKSRSRRRRVRDGTVGGSVAAVLAVVCALVGMQELPPGAGPSSGRGVAAATRGPGVFAADEIYLCLVYDGDRLATAMLSAQVDGERIGNTVAASGGSRRFRVHVEHADTYTLHLDILPGPLARKPLDAPRSVAVEGRDGRIGDDPASGGRALYLETGVGDSILWLHADGTGPRDTTLLAWAKKIAVDTDPSACGS